MSMTRRGLLAGGAAALAAPALAQSSSYDGNSPDAPPLVDRGELTDANVSTFRSHRWQDHWDSLTNGRILCDTQARAVHYWSEDGAIYRIFPSSVPREPELTRTGRTEVVRKRIGPDWAPTANMLRRDPSLPRYVPPGPDNPLGTHALYLSWRYYLIHGTHDTRKIGRRSSSGCIGLYNEDIEELFAYATVGTQVRLI